MEINNPLSAMICVVLWLGPLFFLNSVFLGLGEKAQWIKHLTHKHEDVSSNSKNPYKARHILLKSRLSYDEMGAETGESLEACRPAGLAYAVVNKRFYLKQGGSQGLRLKAVICTPHICHGTCVPTSHFLAC